MGGDGKFEDKHTIFTKHQHSKTSPSDSVLVLFFFFFFFPLLLPHLNLSERPCFWLTDLQPHLVTRSCCQHSFPEKSSCQTTQPWSRAKTRARERERQTERERERERERETRCLAGQLPRRSEGMQPIRSRVTRLTSLR